MRYFWIEHQYSIVVFLGCLLLIALTNLWVLRKRLRSYPAFRDGPRVSILLPARNEQKNIIACVESLLAQEYSNFEVIVLDDQSDDKTASVLRERFGGHPRLTILHGRLHLQGGSGRVGLVISLRNTLLGSSCSSLMPTRATTQER
jgi:cellulose synthase/poly-beta-1,6-N-acetylglucosamine synthase-like glycosyltransferase